MKLRRRKRAKRRPKELKAALRQNRKPVPALMNMTEAVIIFAALLMLASAILAALYVVCRNSRAQPQRQSYRRHRLWNFK